MELLGRLEQGRAVALDLRQRRDRRRRARPLSPLLALALLCAACGDERSPAPVVVAHDAAPGDAPATIPELPGTLWFVEPHALIRIAGGKRTRIEGELFPSRSSLP
ncbi:MAG: hypothetical protein WKG01_29950, partial [Kofleriaceae bacterium]